MRRFHCLFSTVHENRKGIQKNTDKKFINVLVQLQQVPDLSSFYLFLKLTSSCFERDTTAEIFII